MPTPNRELTRIHERLEGVQVELTPDAGVPASSPSVEVSVTVEYAKPQPGRA